MTPEQAIEARQKMQQEEARFQEDLKKYLEENPFTEGDYAAQKVVYEKLVKKVLRLEKNLNGHSHDMKFG